MTGFRLALIGVLAFALAGFTSFNRSLNDKPWGYQQVEVDGRVLDRFEVRPGDCGAHMGWSDCATDRERSEVSQQAPREPVGKQGWYGYSLFLPPDWINVWPTKTALGQFHQENAPGPILMFTQDDKGLFIELVQIKSARTTIIRNEDLVGRWNRIEINARWSRGTDGFVDVYVNGALVFSHRGANTVYPDNVFFKYGIYRTFMSRYKTVKGVPEVPGQVAYFADVRSGATRESLSR